MRILMSVLVVGTGGTGGYVIKELSRYLAARKAGPVTVRFAACDGDIVEKKNLDRQCFLEEDIGLKKAVILTQAVKESFQLEMFAYPYYIEEAEDIGKIFKSIESESYEFNRRYRILIGCVDNHRARQAMEKYYRSVDDIMYVDSANEVRSGEVVTSYRVEKKQFGNPRSFYFPEVSTDRGKKASEKSCSEINLSEPQHILTNMMAGQITLSKVIGFIELGTIAPGIHHFDAFLGISSFTPYKAETKEIKQVDVKKGKKVS